MPSHEEKYRIFISYTRADRACVEKLDDYLQHAGFQPLWDDKLRVGEGFTPQIQDLISHSHLFMAFVTKNSNKRGWVQQEIGYALANNIPVLPVTIGTDPVGIISGVEAVRLDRELPSSMAAGGWEQIADALSREYLSKCLPGTLLAHLVSKAGGHEEAKLCRFVWHNQARVRLLGSYARMARTSSYFGMVRQKTGLTSFCTMDVPPHSIYWLLRYGGGNAREHGYLELIRDERNELFHHVQRCGCRLIVHPGQDYSKYGPTSKLARLAGLIQFLENPPHPDVYVAVDEHEDSATGDSLTLVGDWFAATSVPIRVGSGHRQTVFSMHAPSTQELVRSFDADFAALLQEQKINESDSREHAIARLQEYRTRESQSLGFRSPEEEQDRQRVLEVLRNHARR